MKNIGPFIRRYPIPLVLGLSILVAAILIATKPEPLPADNREKARSVDTITVTTGLFSPSIPVFVKVTTPHHAKLRSSVTADVIKLTSLEGAHVNTGDTLVQLDNKEPELIAEQRRADVLEVKAQIESEKLTHENELFVLGNIKKLDKRGKRNRKNIIKEHRIQLSRLGAQLLRVESALKLALLDLERTNIRSPFNGRITRLHVSIGDRVRPGDAIVDVYDHQALELRGPIATRYIETIQTAIDRGLTLAGEVLIGGQSIVARLDRLSGEINSRSGSVDAIFKVSSNTNLLQLGRNVRLNLQLPPVENTFTVPLEAIYGADTIYKIIDKRLRAVKVRRLGDFDLANGGTLVLLRGPEIKTGDIIMVTQLPYAIENLLVSPNTEK